MKRKMIKVGHSLALALSPEVLQQLGWRDGTHVDVRADAKGKRLVVKKGRKK